LIPAGIMSLTSLLESGGELLFNLLANLAPLAGLWYIAYLAFRELSGKKSKKDPTQAENEPESGVWPPPPRPPDSQS